MRFTGAVCDRKLERSSFEETKGKAGGEGGGSCSVKAGGGGSRGEEESGRGG